MIAYFVHDPEKRSDLILLPDMGRAVPVTPETMRRFIGVQPDFSTWTGEACQCLPLENFGKVVALRETGGDVCVADAGLWENRMNHHLSGGH